MYLNWHSGAVVLCLTHRAPEICLFLCFIILFVETGLNKSFPKHGQRMTTGLQSYRCCFLGLSVFSITFRILSIKGAWQSTKNEDFKQWPTPHSQIGEQCVRSLVQTAWMKSGGTESSSQWIFTLDLPVCLAYSSSFQKQQFFRHTAQYSRLI